MSSPPSSSFPSASPHFHFHFHNLFHSPPPPPPPPQQHSTAIPSTTLPTLLFHSTPPPPPPPPPQQQQPTAIPSTTLPTLYENIHKTGDLDVEKQQVSERKLQAFVKNLNPVPFVPSKNLDFSKHENILKGLGLWDFAHLEFDAGVRMDLITELVASYDPKFQCSYVKGNRITVNRGDLARAMKLTVDKKGVMDNLELSENSKTFLVGFLLNWVVLQGGTWVSIPTEALIMDGHPEKVDWAGLLWFMVEKELSQGEQLRACYYASHLQCLIKSQCEELFLISGEKVVAGPSHKRVMCESPKASNKRLKIDYEASDDNTFYKKMYEMIKKKDELIKKKDEEILRLKCQISGEDPISPKNSWASDIQSGLGSWATQIQSARAHGKDTISPLDSWNLSKRR